MFTEMSHILREHKWILIDILFDLNDFLEYIFKSILLYYKE